MSNLAVLLAGVSEAVQERIGSLMMLYACELLMDMLMNTFVARLCACKELRLQMQTSDPADYTFFRLAKYKIVCAAPHTGARR